MSKLDTLVDELKYARKHVSDVEKELHGARALSERMTDLEHSWNYPYGDDHRESYYESDGVLKLEHGIEIFGTFKGDITVCAVADVEWGSTFGGTEGVRVHSRKVKIGQRNSAKDPVMTFVNWRETLEGLGYTEHDLDYIEAELRT